MEITDSTIKYISLYIVTNYPPFWIRNRFLVKKCKIHFFDLKRLKSTLNAIFKYQKSMIITEKKNITDKKIDVFFVGEKLIILWKKLKSA